MAYDHVMHETHCQQTKTKTECLKPNICYIFGKQGVQGYQMSHSKQSTGQLFVGQQDENRPDLILELVYLLDALP